MPRQGKDQARGFTLIEVVIAIGLLAVALPAYMFAMAQIANLTADVNRDSIAYWVAYNQLETVKLEYQLNERLLKGQSTGQAEMAGQRWEWRVTSEQSELPGMWRVTADVGFEPNEPLVSVVGFIRATEELKQRN